MTTTKPSAPNHLVMVGICVRSQQQTGILFVKIQNGYEMNEVHDVRYTNLATGDLLTRTSSNLWENISRASLAADPAFVQSVSAKTDSYQLVAGDAGKLITLDKATSVNLTVPSGLGWTAGQKINIAQLGTGQVTVVASSSTVNGTPGLKLRAQYSYATLTCLGTNTYLLSGDLSV